MSISTTKNMTKLTKHKYSFNMVCTLRQNQNMHILKFVSLLIGCESICEFNLYLTIFYFHLGLYHYICVFFAATVLAVWIAACNESIFSTIKEVYIYIQICCLTFSIHGGNYFAIEQQQFTLDLLQSTIITEERNENCCCLHRNIQHISFHQSQ